MNERRRITAAEVHGDKPLEAAERAELLRLRGQVAGLEKDNAFLVGVSAYFAAMRKNRPGSSLMAKYAGPDTFAETVSPQRTRFSVRRMARLLGVSTSGYYAHVKRAAATVLTPRQQRGADLEVNGLDRAGGHQPAHVQGEDDGGEGEMSLCAVRDGHSRKVLATTYPTISAAPGRPPLASARE